MEEKLKNMKGQLEIMKTLGIKPNFSELERAFELIDTLLKNIMKVMKENLLIEIDLLS